MHSGAVVKEAVFILLGRFSPTETQPKPRWVPKGNAFCISGKLVFAARHCLYRDAGVDYEELSIARTADRVSGLVYGHVPLIRTDYQDDNADWIILERDPRYSEGVFSHYLQLCDFSNLPRVGSAIRTCYAPCDLILHGENSVLEVTLGPPDLIHQYSPETTPQQVLRDDFEPVLGSIDSPRNDPKAVLISVGNGLHGGCCGAPYVDGENRVVAFHLYSGNDAPVIADVVQDLIEKHAKKRQRTNMDNADEELSTNSGFASIKQGVVLAKLESLVQAIHTLIGVRLNSSVEAAGTT